MYQVNVRFKMRDGIEERADVNVSRRENGLANIYYNDNFRL